MAWIHLLIAGVLEIFWAISLKYTDGFSRLWPSILTVAGMVASFYFLAQALRTIPVGTGYAVWTGIKEAGVRITRHRNEQETVLKCSGNPIGRLGNLESIVPRDMDNPLNR